MMQEEANPPGMVSEPQDEVAGRSAASSTKNDASKQIVPKVYNPLFQRN